MMPNGDTLLRSMICALLQHQGGINPSQTAVFVDQIVGPISGSSSETASRESYPPTMTAVIFCDLIVLQDQMHSENCHKSPEN